MSNEIGKQSLLINLTFFFFFTHINALLRKAISKAITRPNHAHMNSDQGYSSVYVN